MTMDAKPPVVVVSERVDELAGREVTYRKATVVGTIPGLRVISVDIENAGELEGLVIPEGSFYPKIGDVGEVRLQGSRVSWVVNRIADGAVGLDELAPVVTDDIAASKARSETAIGQAEAANAAASQAATNALNADAAALDAAAAADLAAQRAEAARVAAEEAELSSGTATGSVLEAQNAADAANQAAQDALAQATASGTSVTAAEQAAAVAQQAATEAQTQADAAGTAAAQADAKAAQAAADAAKSAADALKAQQDAAAARAAADEAAASAGQATTIAQTAANGKNTITYSINPAPPSNDPINNGRAEGDTWFRQDYNGTIIGHWQYMIGTPYGDVWVVQTLGSQVIANLDVGKLTTGTIAAGQKVSAGPLTGTHAEMADDGFRVFVEDAADGVPNEVVRMGTQTNDFIAVVGADGNLKASIDDTGRVSGSEGNFDRLNVAGRPLGEVVENGAQSEVAFFLKSPGFDMFPIFNKVGIAEVGFKAVKGRSYTFKWRFRAYCDPVNAQVRVDGVWTQGTDGDVYTEAPAPTINSAVFAEWRRYLAGGAANKTTTLQGDAVWVAQRTTRVRLGFVVSLGDEGAFANVGVRNAPVEISVVENGKHVGNTTGQFSAMGGSLNIPSGGTQPSPASAPQSYFWEGKPDGRRSYTGSGALMNVGNDVYQGYSPNAPGNGDQSGQFYFNLPPITGTITGVVLWLYFRHWHYNSGGTARIGLTDQRGYFTRHSFKPLFEVTGMPKPGAKQFYLPADWWPFFKGTNNFDKNGRATVITLGPGGGTNPIFYGVATDATLSIAYDQ